MTEIIPSLKSLCRRMMRMEQKLFQIPFKTPINYWVEACNQNKEGINNFYEWWTQNKQWRGYDEDLHIYPYTHAIPAMLSMGCNNKCKFCPTAEMFKGEIVFGDPEIIIPKYENKIVHFMDENFFKNDLQIILPLLKKYKVTWLAMSTADETLKAFDLFGEKYIHQCGCKIIEVGLENVSLMMKCPDKGIPTTDIQIYYLNMSLLPGETKKTIKNNALWMKDKSLKNPIHFNNGMWYSPGQFYYPYGKDIKNGILLKSPKARTMPTFVPTSFLKERIFIKDLGRTNFYNQFTYNVKFYPTNSIYTVEEFIEGDPRKLAWLIVGIRCGGVE